jgi:hypothetical protein
MGRYHDKVTVSSKNAATRWLVSKIRSRPFKPLLGRVPAQWWAGQPSAVSAVSSTHHIEKDRWISLLRTRTFRTPAYARTDSK